MSCILTIFFSVAVPASLSCAEKRRDLGVLPAADGKKEIKKESYTKNVFVVALAFFLSLSLSLSLRLFSPLSLSLSRAHNKKNSFKPSPTRWRERRSRSSSPPGRRPRRRVPTFFLKRASPRALPCSWARRAARAPSSAPS